MLSRQLSALDWEKVFVQFKMEGLMSRMDKEFLKLTNRKTSYQMMIGCLSRLYLIKCM